MDMAGNDRPRRGGVRRAACVAVGTVVDAWRSESAGEKRDVQAVFPCLVFAVFRSVPLHASYALIRVIRFESFSLRNLAEIFDGTVGISPPRAIRQPEIL